MATKSRRRRGSAPVAAMPYGGGGFGARTQARPQAAPMPRPPIIPTPGLGKGGVGGPAPMPMPPLIPVPQPLPLGPQPQPIQMQPLPEMPQAPVVPPQAPVSGPAPAPTPPAPINDAQMPVGGYQLPNPAPTPPVSDGNFGVVQPMPEPISPIAMPTPNPVPSAPPVNLPQPDQPVSQMPVQAPVINQLPVAPTPVPEQPVQRNPLSLPVYDQPLQSPGGVGGPPQSNPAFIDSIRDQIQNPDRVTGGPALVAPPLTGGPAQDPMGGGFDPTGMQKISGPRSSTPISLDIRPESTYYKDAQGNFYNEQGQASEDPYANWNRSGIPYGGRAKGSIPDSVYQPPSMAPDSGMGNEPIPGPSRAKGSIPDGVYEPPGRFDYGTGVNMPGQFDYGASGGPIPDFGPGKGGPLPGLITGKPTEFDAGTGSPPVMGGGMMMPGSLGDQFATSNAQLSWTLDQYGNPVAAPGMPGQGLR